MKKIISISLLPLSILYASEDGTPTPRNTSVFTFSTPTSEQGTFTTGITAEQKTKLKEYYIAAQNNPQVQAKTFVPSLVAPKEDSHVRNMKRVSTAMSIIIRRVTPIENVENVTLFEEYKKSVESIQERIKRDETNLTRYTGETLALRKLELELYKKYEKQLNTEIESFSRKLLMTTVD